MPTTPPTVYTIWRLSPDQLVATVTISATASLKAETLISQEMGRLSGGASASMEVRDSTGASVYRIDRI